MPYLKLQALVVYDKHEEGAGKRCSECGLYFSVSRPYTSRPDTRKLPGLPLEYLFLRRHLSVADSTVVVFTSNNHRPSHPQTPRRYGVGASAGAVFVFTTEL